MICRQYRPAIWRFSVLFVLAICTNANVNGQQIQWAIGDGSWVDETVNKVVVDAKGNVYTTGKIGSFTSAFGVNFDEWGYFLLKQNKAGTIKWVRYSKGSYDAVGEGLAIDSKGSVYVAGTFHYNLDLGDTTLQGAAQGPEGTVFFIKYDSLGNRKWARSLGPDGNVGGAHLTIDQQDNIYLAGVYTYSVNLGSGMVVTTDHPYYFPFSDIFISRWTDTGHPMWGISVSASGDDYLDGFQAGPNGNVNLIAEYSSNNLIAGLQSYTLKGNYGSYLLSCSPTGIVTKVLSIDEGATDLAISNAREFYISGNSSALSGAYVSKFKQDYILEWTKPIGRGFRPSAPVPLAVSGNDVYVGADYYSSVTIDSTSLNAGHGLFIAKFSSIGVLQWAKNYSGTSSSYSRVNSLAAAGNGSIAIAGVYSESTYNFDGHVITNKSGNNDVDAFVCMLKDPTTSVCPGSTSRVSAVVRPVCRGDSLLLSTNAGPGYYLMAWYSGNQFIKSSNTFYAKENGNYHYVRYPGSTCAKTSNSINLSLIELASKKISPIDTVTCNQPVTLKAVNDAQYTYQWYKDAQPIPQETNATLIATQSGSYYCSILKLGLCQSKTDVAKIQVFQEPSFKVISVPVSPGTFRFYASDTRSISAYQWTVSGTNLRSSLASPTFSLSPGLYKVCLQAFNLGCAATSCLDQPISSFVTGLEGPVSPAVTAFPNPFNESFIMAHGNGEEFSAKIFDQWGQLIESIACNESFEFRTGTWPPGIYLARISHGGSSSTIKLVKK